MGKHFYKVVAVVLVVVLMTAIASPASAKGYSPYYSTSATTTDTNLYEAERTLASYTLTTVNGNQAGLEFLAPLVGLSAGFDTNGDRTAFISCTETDSNKWTPFRNYTAIFAKSGNVQSVASCSCTYTYTGQIESDAIVNLMMGFSVDSLPGDTQTAVPTGIIVYRYWVD